MRRYLPLTIVVSAGVIILAGCAPVHYKKCNLTCFAKPKPKPVPIIPTPAPVSTIPLKIAPVERTILESKPITIRGINFATGSYHLRGEDKDVLTQVERFVNKHPEAVLLVKGYCSKTGSYQYNLRLSRERASSVASYLVAHGVPSSSIITHGYSWSDPVATNATAQGRFLNQRVVIDSTIQVKKTVADG